ncbi:hypothetical protein GQ600_17049 [Phytophthora cactorum]|nr:hypothetical protein GQ600_17049 [Phytophthora cactorum]
MTLMWPYLINQHTHCVCSGRVCLEMGGLWIQLQNRANAVLTQILRFVYTL